MAILGATREMQVSLDRLQDRIIDYQASRGAAEMRDLTQACADILSPQLPDANAPILCQVRTTQSVVFNGVPDSLLRVQMMVWQKGETLFESLLGYYCDIQLLDPATNIWENIGFINAWGFSKRTAQHPNNDNAVFWDDWLESPVDNLKYIKGTDCIANALRRIYVGDQVTPGDTPNRGTLRNEVLAPFIGDFASVGTPAGNEIIYIQSLFVEHERLDAERAPLNPPVRVSVPSVVSLKS